jgi:hypothetical protein
MDLPKHYHTQIVQINPTNTENGFDASAAFCSLLDELKTELEEDPENGGFYHNRASLLKAYGENRMYGLCAYFSLQMLQKKSFDDSIFVTNKHFTTHRMLPCFLVLEKEWDFEPSICEKVWVAKRARKKGMASYLLNEFDVRKATLSLPEAEAFWTKHFARVQSEIDKNENT